MRIDEIKLGVMLAKCDLNYMGLAKKAKVSKATISSIKNGKSCSFVTAVRIADALDVEVTDLLEE